VSDWSNNPIEDLGSDVPVHHSSGISMLDLTSGDPSDMREVNNLLRLMSGQDPGLVGEENIISKTIYIISHNAQLARFNDLSSLNRYRDPSSNREIVHQFADNLPFSYGVFNPDVKVLEELKNEILPKLIDKLEKVDPGAAENLRIKLSTMDTDITSLYNNLLNMRQLEIAGEIDTWIAKHTSSVS
jgi:hypothetical protein